MYQKKRLTPEFKSIARNSISIFFIISAVVAVAIELFVDGNDGKFEDIIESAQTYEYQGHTYEVQSPGVIKTNQNSTTIVFNFNIGVVTINGYGDADGIQKLSGYEGVITSKKIKEIGCTVKSRLEDEIKKLANTEYSKLDYYRKIKGDLIHYKAIFCLDPKPVTPHNM